MQASQNVIDSSSLADPFQLDEDPILQDEYALSRMVEVDEPDDHGDI